MDGEIVVKGKTFALERKLSYGTTATARVKGDTIVISIPSRLGRDEGASIFARLKERVIRRLERDGPDALSQRELGFRDGQELSLMGRRFSIRVSDRGGHISRARVSDGTVMIRLAGGLSYAERQRHVSALARRALSREVLPGVVARVKELNALHFDFEFRAVKLRDSAWRWGSYSARTGSVQLNFRLLFAPQEVMDSVIVHELAHIKEPRHTKRFWALVTAAVPDYKERRRWLNKNGNMLGIPSSEGMRTASPAIVPESAPVSALADGAAEPA